MLFRQIERLRDSVSVKDWAVVTSDDPTDEELRTECKKRGISVFAGSLNDVLDRFYQAAQPSKPDHVVRVTGDCPLIDPEILDRLVDLHLAGHFDYSSSAIAPSFPDGLDCEIFRYSLLERAWKEAKLPSQREHVTPYMYLGYPENPHFRVGSLGNSPDYSALRWTVDEPVDFTFVKSVYEKLYPKKPGFRMNDVLELLKQQPDLAKGNQAIQRNEGYAKSLAKDHEKNSK